MPRTDPPLSDDELLDRFQRGGLWLFPGNRNPGEWTGRRHLAAELAGKHRRRRLRAVLLSHGVERGWMTRDDAARRTLATLRFFETAGKMATTSTGHKGFYYHFLDLLTGKRVWRCEVSMVDTALLFAGMLAAGAYFSGDQYEVEIRDLTDALYGASTGAGRKNGGQPSRRAGSPSAASFTQLGRLQRRDAPLCAGDGFTTASAADDELCGLDRDISVGKHLRLRRSLWRAALHASVFTCLDRFR